MFWGGLILCAPFFVFPKRKLTVGGIERNPWEQLKEPLLELVREAKVTNIYLRKQATAQFKYTTSQATQYRDPDFKKALIGVSGLQACMPAPRQVRLHPIFHGEMLQHFALNLTVFVASLVLSG